MADLPADLPLFLDQIVERYHRTEVIGNDPLQFPRRFTEPADQEVVALLAALLAWGRVAQIANVMTRLLERLGPRPAETISGSTLRQLQRLTEGIVHRVLTSRDLAKALSLIGRAIADHGSLQAIFLRGHRQSHPTVIPALTQFVETLCPDNSKVTRGIKHLFPKPDRGSACKRWMLFLRWVVRPRDGVDLGLWPEVSPSGLIIPLDTHIQRIALNLRLTHRRNSTLKTALDVTESLRAWRPNDPVGCDFALSRLGIHQVCPSTVDPVICEGCGLRSVCLHGSS